MNKRIPAIILMVATFLTSSYAATAYKKSITVEGGTRVEFDNQTLDMRDVNGKPVDAFIYQGTTYVPVRAVSNAFGADIYYDQNTNMVSVYDDLGEVCGVAHEMSGILSRYYDIVLLDLASVADRDTATSNSSANEELKTSVDNMYDTLTYLASDEGYNSNLRILTDGIVDKYQKAIMSCLNATQAYETFVKNKSDYNAYKFIDCFHLAVDDYYDAQSAIDDLFNNYCLWRELPTTNN